MPGGVPGLGPRRNGGRATYARGGSVKSGPAYEEGLRAGTQVQHSPGKNDLKDIGRGKPITLRHYQDNLRRQFHKLDRNHDGYLDARELTQPPQA